MWRRNPVASWPTDPAEALKLSEKMWAVIDALIKKGEVKEFGYFLDGTSGYTIGEGKTTEAFRNVSMFSPFFEFEVHKIIPYPQAGKSLGNF